MPANLFVFLLIVGSVIGASAYIKSLSGTVTVTSVDYAGFAPVDFTEGQNIAVSGGQSVIKTFRISNTGDTYAMDATVTFEVTDTLANGDCKIWLRKSDNSELAEDTTIENNKLSVVGSYPNIAAQASVDGKFEVQCNPDFNDDLSYTLTMEPTSKFTFKD